jgi:hypothetical protein
MTEICDGRGRSWRWCGRDPRRARSEAGATEKAAAEAGGGELFPSRVHGDGRGARPAACVEEEAVAGEEGGCQGDGRRRWEIEQGWVRRKETGGQVNG